MPSTRRGDSPTSTVFVEPGTSFVLYDAPLLSAVTGLEWACAVASIDSETYAEFARDPGLTPLETYVREKIRHQFGFPSYDTKCMLRLLVEAFPAEEAVTYDLTDLVLDGEVESTSDAAGYADHLASQDYDRSRFAITLTEGSSDRWIIERSFKVLSPHLSDFFSFMDFGGANMPGGAGQLANIVRSFAGAKIANRVIALFDNDTAGHSALQSLSSITLPENIRVLSLPDIAIASRYPTLGPGGLTELNVNGLAGGIELYLGAECLTERDGQLAPIQWKGYDPRMRRYQGELLGKNDVLDRLSKKLASCESDATRVDDFEWQDLRSIMDMLRTAFHDLDVSEIIEFGTEHG